MDVHLILNLFIYASIQIMDTKNLNSGLIQVWQSGSLLSNADIRLPWLSKLVLNIFIEYIWLVCSLFCPGFLPLALTLHKW